MKPIIRIKFTGCIATNNVSSAIIDFKGFIAFQLHRTHAIDPITPIKVKPSNLTCIHIL